MYTWAIMASFEGGLLEGTSRLILRSQSDTPLLPSIGIDCEFQLLKFLKSKKFKVPKPIYLDRSGLLTGNPAFIMQKTTGSSKFIGADSKLNILDRKQLTRDIGHQLGKLHKLKIPSNQLRLFKKTGEQSVIDRLYTQLDLLPYSLPVIEWALRLSLIHI